MVIGQFLHIHSAGSTISVVCHLNKIRLLYKTVLWGGKKVTKTNRKRIELSRFISTALPIFIETQFDHQSPIQYFKNQWETSGLLAKDYFQVFNDETAFYFFFIFNSVEFSILCTITGYYCLVNAQFALHWTHHIRNIFEVYTHKWLILIKHKNNKRMSQQVNKQQIEW